MRLATIKIRCLNLVGTMICSKEDGVHLQSERRGFEDGRRGFEDGRYKMKSKAKLKWVVTVFSAFVLWSSVMKHMPARQLCVKFE